MREITNDAVYDQTYLALKYATFGDSAYKVGSAAVPLPPPVCELGAPSPRERVFSAFGLIVHKMY